MPANNAFNSMLDSLVPNKDVVVSVCPVHYLYKGPIKFNKDVAS